MAVAAETLQIAVAQRPILSSAVSAAIAEVGEAAACRTLLANPGADIARISRKSIAERFGDAPDMRDTLLSRPGLPADVRQMLVRLLGDTLGALVGRFAADQTREAARDYARMASAA